MYVYIYIIYIYIASISEFRYQHELFLEETCIFKKVLYVKALHIWHYQTR